MIREIDRYIYEISTEGLGGKMLFSSGASCGKIRNGISLNIEPLHGGWVIPLSEAWQMVLVSTVGVIEQSVWCTFVRLKIYLCSLLSIKFHDSTSD